MFYTLPNELIREITKWLSTQDKLCLMKVNSHLYNSISQNGLYENLSIYSEPHTEALVTRLACRPAQAIQVRSLLLKSHTLSDQLLRQLPIIFPGVKHFTDLSKNYGIKRTDPSRYLFRWANTIQVFDCLYDHIELCFYLENNTFQQLQQLVLTQYDCTKLIPIRLDLNLMECIKHAPSLTTLSLKDCQVDLDFMETIHENCPNLNSLDFRSAFIRVIETKLPSTIVPVKPFTVLKIDYPSVILDSHCVFRDYILEKYPCLKHFECLSSFMKTEFSAMCRYFRCTRFDINSELDFRSEHLATLIAYYERRSTMFSNLPKSLETVMFYLYHLETTPTLYLHNYTDLQSEALSRMNGAIKNYNRFTTKRLHLVINSDLQKHTMAHFSNHLTTLEVSFESKRDIKTMHLGWLLSHFPFLQVLYILNSDVILIGEPVTFTGKVNPTTFDNNGTYHNGVRVYLSLVKVSIRNSSTEEGLLDYIRYIAPNLTDIGWVAYQQEYKRHSLFQGSTIEWNRFEPMERRLVYDFDFSCFFLNIVNINICFDQGEHDVYIAFDRGKRTGSIVFTMDGNKLVKWRYSEKGDEQLEKRINIKCASCQKIRLNHTISLK